MTTIETTVQICGEFGCDEIATESVTASYLDPDDDGTGHMIGWSRPVHSYLCQEHADEAHDDDQVQILEAHTL
jgi:hypothetical protein